MYLAPLKTIWVFLCPFVTHRRSALTSGEFVQKFLSGLSPQNLRRVRLKVTGKICLAQKILENFDFFGENQESRFRGALFSASNFVPARLSLVSYSGVPICKTTMKIAKVFEVILSLIRLGNFHLKLHFSLESVSQSKH